ncbi:feruloyl esterase [Pseudosulfitobacter pseudonitzschiae]|uniref:Feruloyl esterase n=1 Tax=Pseudosulfitobacter pseudonitzschiae TaxID=1402135 RepID=A0A073JDY3_9RHOB|nr:tannase/feruloyl esterase family alpha/beta hydrolase [Pseudosulfitobacter pseudonitzschiae]KEJ95942.1 feruloyl esterase [Pseudosulfitobacter pseudonitzschiae]QKS09896.1 tannase/feruloyl esterase family alpha/beta hydrolase [Pseudosulfitobacter pseudonitzschiae]SHE91629.1 feruloyl esterase [Pseudosulfitobacter pseudonitzschiae]
MFKTMGTAALLCSTATLAAAQMQCEGLTPEALGLSGVTFTEVAPVPAGEDSPAAQCRIRAVTAERTGTDGRDYALQFELALPDVWNGDYVHQFNGGNDGEVKPATGGLGAGTGDETPLARGFAVVSSDAGHDGKAVTDAGLAGGARFGFDLEARQMYGYKAVAVLDPLARQIVEAYYDNEIGHSYGIGCSNGGRHAMVAASRMPQSFDGLLIGAPGFNLPKAALQHAVDVQALTAVTGDLATAFSPADLQTVADGILQACDALDGIEDGLVMDTANCQASFDSAALQCAEGQNSACLSPEQVTALNTIHAGTADGGAPFYSDFPWDPGIAGGGWRFWKLESPIPPWEKKPIIAVMGAASLAQIFTTPPTEVAGDPAALEQFLKDFDLTARADEIYDTSDAFPESAMEVMTPPGSDNPELAEFRDAGGKMILFHGVSDPVFSVNDTADWYGKLDTNNGGNAGEFAKFYPVPGMTHCSGGPAVEGFDMFAELVAWVENGTEPQAVTATARASNPDLPETMADISRPLCPAPQVARYTGSDPASADSFTCE